MQAAKEQAAAAAKDAVIIMSREDWLKSLQGQDGSNGTNGENGKSALELLIEAKELPENATVNDLIHYLKGKDGSNGTDGEDGKMVNLRLNY